MFKDLHEQSKLSETVCDLVVSDWINKHLFLSLVTKLGHIDFDVDVIAVQSVVAFRPLSALLRSRVGLVCFRLTLPALDLLGVDVAQLLVDGDDPLGPAFVLAIFV